MEVSNQEVITEQAPVANLSAEEVAHNEAMDSHFKEGEGLPTPEEAPKPDMFNGQSDEWKEANLKDGKLFGKFDNLDDMAKSYKKINDERANQGSEAKANEAKQTATENRNQVSNAQLNEIAENGFNITEDNFKAFEDAGMSRMEAENMAFKMEKAANQAYGYVGGKDNYNTMMQWAEANLDATQIQAFAHETIGDNFSIKPSGEFAIRGLQAMMNGSTKQAEPTQRISGSTPSRQQTAGFGSKTEYQTAMNHLRRNPTDRSAQAEYESKMKLTDMRNLV